MDPEEDTSPAIKTVAAKAKVSKLVTCSESESDQSQDSTEEVKKPTGRATLETEEEIETPAVKSKASAKVQKRTRKVVKEVVVEETDSESEEAPRPKKVGQKKVQPPSESSEEEVKPKRQAKKTAADLAHEKAKKQADKEAQALADRAASKIVNQRQALRDLCRTMSTIFGSYKRVMGQNTSGARDPLVETVTKYLEQVNAGNYKFSAHRIQFLDLYRTWRNEFLSCDNVPPEGLWLKHKRVDCLLGKGTQVAKMNIVLKIGMAYSKAMLMHERMDAEIEELQNENDQDEIRIKFEYKLYAELMAHLIGVIILAIEDQAEDERIDIPRLKECVRYYNDLREEDDPTVEEKEAAERDAAEAMKKVGGGRIRGMGDMMGMVTDLLGGEKFMETAEKKIQDIERMDKEGSMGIKSVMSVLSEGLDDFEPIIEDTVGRMQRGNKEPTTKEAPKKRVVKKKRTPAPEK